MKYQILAVVVILILAGAGVYYYSGKKPNDNKTMVEPKILRWENSPAMVIGADKKYTAILETSEGTIKAELFAGETPATVNNFVFLARQGFYDGTKFHRIIKNFMIQGGDPLGNGTGGPGYKFNDEPVKRDYERGIVAMANSGPNTNGSQFFIMTKNTPLPKNYVIFGKLIDGFDVLDKIAATPVGPNSMGELSSPVSDVIIKSARIEETGR